MSLLFCSYNTFSTSPDNSYHPTITSHHTNHHSPHYHSPHHHTTLTITLPSPSHHTHHHSPHHHTTLIITPLTITPHSSLPSPSHHTHAPPLSFTLANGYSDKVISFLMAKLGEKEKIRLPTLNILKHIINSCGKPISDHVTHM